MRWNLSSRARELSGGDAILISIPKEIKERSVDALLRHPRFGIAVMVEVMNGWITEFGDRSDFTIVRYEDLRAEPARLFHELLRAIGEKEIDNAVFGPAIDFSA